MSAFLIAYTIVGLITWAGIIAQVIADNHAWRIRDFFCDLPATMIGVTALWPVGFAFWQYKEWRKESSYE